ncbi:hypothetical protein B296_00018490 [Ensete ventricosum]|uniref:Uncharacterized protein n=1 Tax=Ensete ventricosum TaxID=4639 RepID=A0A426YWH3_ENSVE|nr:hypothetical protein B296_00018490 [Ensete ventricosum]
MSPSSPLHRRQLPLPTDSHCPYWQQHWPPGLPLAGWSLAATPCKHRLQSVASVGVVVQAMFFTVDRPIAGG